MSCPQIPLKQLGKVSVGLSIHRYKCNAGVTERVVQSGNLRKEHPEWDHGYISADLDTMTFQGSKTKLCDKHRLQVNDIVIAIRQGTKAALVTPNIVGSIAVGPNVARFRPEHPQVLDPVYLLTLFSTSGLSYSLDTLERSADSGIGIITAKQLKEVKIPLPTISVQAQVVRMFSAKKKISRIHHQIEQTYQDLAQTMLRTGSRHV